MGNGRSTRNMSMEAHRVLFICLSIASTSAVAHLPPTPHRVRLLAKPYRNCSKFLRVSSFSILMCCRTFCALYVDE